MITLIKWKGGTVPASTRKEDKNDLVIAWEAVQPPREEMEARAGRPAAPAAPKKKAAKPKRTRTEPDSSDEEEDEEIDQDEVGDGRGDGDDGMACDRDEDSEDDGDEDEDEDGYEDDEDEEEDEEGFDVKCIHAVKGKGANMKYHVEWEGYEEWTWEPAAYLQCTFALQEWEAKKSQKPKEKK